MRAPPVAAIVAVTLVTGCDTASPDENAAPARSPGSGHAGASATAGRWKVDVSLRPNRIGPVAFAARNLTRAPSTDSKPWLNHDLVFRNAGESPVKVDDTRSSSFVGQGGRDQLVVADEGCGYGSDGPGDPVEAGVCQLDLDLLTLEPGASEKRSITLFKGLRGMDALVAGRYVFERPVRFLVKGDREKRSGTLRITYDIATRN
jgi:hypothetical protein